MKFDRNKVDYSLVAYIDILGFSDKAGDIATIKDLKDLFSEVRFVQNAFSYDPKTNLQKKAMKQQEKKY